MLPTDNQRLQYIYFLISGIVASSLLILTYVSLWSRSEEKLQNDLKSMQLTLELIKPSSLIWSYNNTWRYIGHPTLGQKVYSAYFDRRIHILDNPTKDGISIAIGSVRIFAILPLYFRNEITCIFRGEDFSLAKTKAESFKPMKEHHDAAFAAYAIVCPLYKHMNESLRIRLPHAVALTYEKNTLSRLSPTFVPISYPRDMDQLFAKSKPVLSVCVPALQLNASSAVRVVEFIEVYRLLGATHFYFYIANPSRDVQRVLRFYRDNGLADILHWNLNDHERDLYENGAVAQINDCIYRTMVVDNFRYATIVDLDEILIPLKHNSLLQFMLQCDEGLSATYVFRNVFFYKKDKDDTFSVPAKTLNPRLYTQTKVRRTLEVLPAYTQSRFIVNPQAIIEMGMERMWRCAPGYVDHILSPTVGLLFHYRDRCINCRTLMLVDYTARRFGSLLWDRVDDTCLQTFLRDKGTCPTK